jgi:hypothetical protein
MFFRKQQTESTEPKFKTERQLIFHIIHNFTKIDTYLNLFYKENALPEWKEKYEYVNSWNSKSSYYYTDQRLLRWLADNSEDEEILLALYASNKVPLMEENKKDGIYYFKWWTDNVNLPDSIIVGLFNAIAKYNKNPRVDSLQAIRNMQKIEYKNISDTTKDLIADHIVKEEQRIREDKEAYAKERLSELINVVGKIKGGIGGKTVDELITSDDDVEILNLLIGIVDNNKTVH